MQESAKLCSLARGEIDALLADGITPTPEEIVEINALAWRIVNPETRRLLARGRPVSIGGYYLWPLTMRAIDWLEANECDLDKVTPALGYAMCYGRSESSELDVYGIEAEKAVKAWFRSLRVHMNEFIEAVSQVDAQDTKPELPPDPTGKPMTLGDFSCFLSATCGGNADFWERRVSLSYGLSVLSMIVQQNHADKRPCAQDPRIIAERAMGFAVEKIRARHKAEEAVNGQA